MMRKLWLATAGFFIAISLAGCSAASTPAPRQAATSVDSPYIGAPYPPPPPGWEEGRGALAASIGDVDYTVQELTQGKQQMLWFMKSTGRDAQGHVKWIVTDVLNRSDLLEPGSLSWGFCTLNDQPDEEIIALGEVKAARLEKATRAWRANHTSGRFEPLATTGIVCEDQTIGP